MSSATGIAHPATALEVPSFRFLLGSSLASAFGAAMTSVAVNWLVYHYTRNPIDVAYVGLTGVVPGIALGLFAGVMADRYNRRRVMVACDLARLALMAGLAAALYLSGFSLVLVLAVMTLVYSFSALFNPASQAMLPRLVSTDQLEDANGLLAALTQGGSTVGAAAGGVVIVFAGAVAGLGVNALTYALSATFLFQIAVGFGQVPARAGALAFRSIGRDIAEGMHYMRTHLGVLEATLSSIPSNFLIAMAGSFLVIYAAVVFGGEAAVYGYLVAGIGAGTVVGALAVRRLKARRYAGYVMIMTTLVAGGTIGLLVVARTLPLSLVAAVVFGVAIGIVNPVYVSTMQAIVPNEILARVMGIDLVGSFVAIPAGLLVGGVLIEAFGVLTTYAIAAVGLAVIGVAMLGLRDLRNLRYGN